MVNLAVDLRVPRFDDAALARALEAIEAAGYGIERVRKGDDAFLAWLDAEFGGTWSSEAFAGTNIIARDASGNVAGFATYDPRALQFSWLRGMGAQDGVGIFGPFGVAPAHRKSGIGPHLLTAALASLRERGYVRALIPAVGEEKLVDYYRANAGAQVVERFDKRSWFDRRYRATVLASGSGTNLQAVLDASAGGRLPVEVTAVISNVEGAYALTRAQNAGIETVLAIPWQKKEEARDTYDSRLIAEIERMQPDLVLLLGWMHLLSPPCIDALPEMLNVHPAFLPLDPAADTVAFPDGTVTPAYRGARAVRDALREGSTWIGASVHRVTNDTDRGDIMLRKPLRVQNGEAETALMERLHPLEHRVLTGAIMRWAYER